MNHVLLMGNPNVGKSVVFSRLTGIHVMSSNYPGTTVEFSQGYMKVGAEKALVVDAPGVYGLEPTCKAAEIALAMIEKADAIINVVDATNLERSLHLTLHLLEKGLPIIIALNIWDEAKHKGIHIDVQRLEKELVVPIVPTVAITGEGIRELLERIPEAATVKNAPRTEEERWTEVGRLTSVVQSLEHRHHTLLEFIGDVSVKPSTGLPIAAGVLCASFLIIRLLGEGLTRLALDPVFQSLWKPLLMRWSAALDPAGFVHAMLIGTLVNGEIDFIRSFGLLTTGLYVAGAIVFPYVLAFYLVLGFLEDFGYLPRLAVLLDTLMHRMGLHGWAVIPMLLGFGCNVPGIMATRVLESPRERWIASTLVSIAVPCASLQAMLWGILGHHGARYAAAVYLVLFAVWVILGRILNAVLAGTSPELILEIPPYRLPAMRTVLSKLAMRIRSYFVEAVPFVILGVVAVNLLHFFRLFDAVANAAAPLVTNVFGLPKEAALAVVVGFLRKDVAVGMLAGLDMTPKQLVISATVLAMSFPCVATFVILGKELGARGLLKSIATMVVSALLVGAALNLIL